MAVVDDGATRDASWRRTIMVDWARYAAYLAVAAYLLALWVVPEGFHVWREAVLQPLAFGMIGVYVWLRAYTDPRERRWLIFVALWMTTMTVGNILANLPRESQWASVFDIAGLLVFVLSYPCAIGALVSAHRGTWRPRRPGQWLDVLVSVSAVITVFAALILPTVVAASTDEPFLVAFPALDLMAMSMTAAVVALSGSPPRTVTLLLGLSLAMNVAVDWRFVLGTADHTWVNGRHIDSVWVIAAAVAGLLAGSRSARDRAPDMFGIAPVIVPVMASGVAVLVLTAGTRVHLHLSGVILADITMLGSMIRLVLTHLEVRSLLITRRLAHTDELTGLGNRRAFYERLNSASVGRHATFSLLLADLNGFKQVNDTLGHQAGDQVLIRTAECLRATMPNGTGLFRIGGDEFAVTIRGQDAAQAEALAVQLSHAVSRIQGCEGLDFGVSIGIATMSAGETVSHSELIHRADLAMYDAKRDRSGPRHYQPHLHGDGRRTPGQMRPTSNTQTAVNAESGNAESRTSESSHSESTVRDVPRPRRHRDRKATRDGVRGGT